MFESKIIIKETFYQYVILTEVYECKDLRFAPRNELALSIQKTINQCTAGTNKE